MNYCIKQIGKGLVHAINRKERTEDTDETFHVKAVTIGLGTSVCITGRHSKRLLCCSRLLPKKSFNDGPQGQKLRRRSYRGIFVMRY